MIGEDQGEDVVVVEEVDGVASVEGDGVVIGVEVVEEASKVWTLDTRAYKKIKTYLHEIKENPRDLWLHVSMVNGNAGYSGVVIQWLWVYWRLWI